MKNVDIKILAVILFFVTILYLGVEPFAHSQMHKHIDDADFAYDAKGDNKVLLEQNHKQIDDFEEIKEINAKEIMKSKKRLQELEEFDSEEFRDFWIQKLENQKQDPKYKDQEKEIASIDKEIVKAKEMEVEELKNVKTFFMNNYKNMIDQENFLSKKIDQKITDAENESQQQMDDVEFFWNEAEYIASLEANISNGKKLVQMSCTGCHGISTEGILAPMDDATAKMSFGVVPPDLSTSGKIYDKKFLAALIKNPIIAMNLEHKFDNMNPHPMPPFFGAGGDISEEIADMVGYLKDISKDVTLSDKEVFINACARCHDVRYDGILGSKNDQYLAKYMGSIPPDLSMIIRAKSKQYLRNFIYNPQMALEGTAMPRVGLDKNSTEQVINYLESIGDSKKEERERVILKIVAFLVFIMILAYLWKKLLWRELKD
ncbi:MAG: ubiquinol cytochrome C oxidoreductase, cytochrome C1 subunit [uncultured Campylobacterales bacterium]|uniref:Ubiquinol cytochrome C oxidoreductase, cytochrome C1 subunit n=1 Tax=uncultured Campylobacterales bacterium TaxID=352960 RepID=A0A6S6S306_9BACT|nr:MAG: ubiquinol cytochrome C oxidoreductase, cytochrome C1 subunit [uncultured Campylobacterales bacterium]